MLYTGVDPKSMVTVVGNLPDAAKGQQLRFVGDWVLHPKHSWQLKATAYEEVVPSSTQAVVAYLASTIGGELSAYLGYNLLEIQERMPDSDAPIQYSMQMGCKALSQLTKFLGGRMYHPCSHVPFKSPQIRGTCI